ncbi:hypothetical protein [Xylocopilactobacillus apicola]|uniref:Uncharacterized protein n=1 Tax=Xylocopilactobacillus apicola TaxID=2932184 RepID=A0AAU9CWL7_9LACO|nr:hypothetical protein [Xylocopilactobacillus apicola]BDR58364.1 hypothetical protein XA3_08050 [Xylocopilactobacillus apicola]
MLSGEFRNYNLIIEPGSALVRTSEVLLTKVIDCFKNNRITNNLVVN